jgi:hypothetical protein
LRLKPRFGGAVEEDNGEGEPEPAEARRKSHEAGKVKEIQEVK